MNAPAEVHGIPLDHYRLLHSTAHVMATAIKRLWPDARFTVGPPISRPYLGFYYDFDMEYRVTIDDLAKISKEMKIIMSPPMNNPKLNTIFSGINAPADELNGGNPSSKYNPSSSKSSGT